MFIARGKEDALVTKNIVPGESVYGEKRISVDVRIIILYIYKVKTSRIQHLSDFTFCTTLYFVPLNYSVCMYCTKPLASSKMEREQGAKKVSFTAFHLDKL